MRRLIFIFVLALVIIPVLHHFAQAEVIEELADRTEGANGAEGEEHPDPADTSFSDVFPPLETSGGEFITGIDYRFDTLQDATDAFTGVDKKILKPKVGVALADTAPEGGQSNVLMARPENFEQLYTEQYFLWCFGTRESRIAQNGMVAGGERIPAAANGTDCYDDVTRRPTDVNDVDANNDGIGDRWAVRNFGNINIDPNGDPDQDGFLMDGKKGVIGPNGIIRLVPNSFTGGFFNASCDGFFPNSEEYTWGTNPIDPDTDDDGYPDEEDVCGKGQISFDYEVPEDATEEDAEFLEIITVGYSLFRQNDGQIRVSKIANSGKTLYFGKGEPLVGFLEHRIVNELTQDAQTRENKATSKSQKEIYVNDLIEFRASVENTAAEEGNLHYQWKFKLLDGGVDSPNNPNRVIDEVGLVPSRYGIPDGQVNGYGLNPYRLKVGTQSTQRDSTGFSIQPKTGNKVEATVVVIEPQTGKKTEITETFTISMSVTIDFEPGLPIRPVYPGADASTAPVYTITANVPGINPSEYLFEWFIDEERLPNSKIGASSVEYTAKKVSGKYKVSLIITRVVDESIFAKVEMEAPISPLALELTNCIEYETNQNLSAGQTITLSALINADGEFPGTLQFQWFMNGQELTAPSPTPVNSVSFIPESIGSYNISYVARSVAPTEATETAYVPFEVSQTCNISVTSGGEQTTAKATRLLASVVNIAPAVLRGSLAFAAIAFVIIVVIFALRSKVNPS